MKEVIRNQSILFKIDTMLNDLIHDLSPVIDIDKYTKDIHTENSCVSESFQNVRKYIFDNLIKEENKLMAQRYFNHSERYYDEDGNNARVVRVGQITHELEKRLKTLDGSN